MWQYYFGKNKFVTKILDYSKPSLILHLVIFKSIFHIVYWKWIPVILWIELRYHSRADIQIYRYKFQLPVVQNFCMDYYNICGRGGNGSLPPVRRWVWRLRTKRENSWVAFAYSVIIIMCITLWMRPGFFGTFQGFDSFHFCEFTGCVPLTEGPRYARTWLWYA